MIEVSINIYIAFFTFHVTLLSVFFLWQGVCPRIGIDIGDRLSRESRKLKFLIEKLPRDFPAYQDQLQSGSQLFGFTQ